MVPQASGLLLDVKRVELFVRSSQMLSRLELDLRIVPIIACLQPGTGGLPLLHKSLDLVGKKGGGAKKSQQKGKGCSVQPAAYPR
jgi:hypothetical protein